MVAGPGGDRETSHYSVPLWWSGESPQGCKQHDWPDSCDDRSLEPLNRKDRRGAQSAADLTGYPCRRPDRLSLPPTCPAIPASVSHTPRDRWLPALCFHTPRVRRTHLPACYFLKHPISRPHYSLQPPNGCFHLKTTFSSRLFCGISMSWDVFYLF